MHDWKVVNLNYLLHDQQILKYNIVQSIEWSVSKEHVFSEEEHGVFRVEKHGTVEVASPGEIFVPFESITEGTAVSWAKNALGVEEVLRIEAELDSELVLLITPTHGSGRPWADGGI